MIKHIDKFMVAGVTLTLAACPKGNTTPAVDDPCKDQAVVQTEPCADYQAPEGVEKWMAWEGGVDLVGMTSPDLPGPNVIVHVARSVSTPEGTAPSGLIYYHPDPNAAPAVMGFVSGDPKVGAYFGPNIFAGTPFEGAPALDAEIEVEDGDGTVTARAQVAGHDFVVTMTGVGDATPVDRAAGNPMPFQDHSREAVAASATLTVNGEPVELTSAGNGPIWSPCGVYTR